MAPRKFNINSKTITAPLAAFVMASILFVYARTSIQVAKRNAQKHREADGGQISWRNESLRRHGVLEPPEDQGAVRQLLLGGGKAKDAKEQGAPAATAKGERGEVVQGLGRTEEEERIRAVAATRGRGRDGG
jgi:hypothetical protein